jgi:hypothetical protein
MQTWTRSADCNRSTRIESTHQSPSPRGIAEKSCRFSSDRCLSPRLKWKQQRKTAGADDQRASDVDRYRSIKVRVYCDNGRLYSTYMNMDDWQDNLALGRTHQDAKNASRSCGKPIPSATVVGWEHLGRDGVQHAIHSLANGYVSQQKGWGLCPGLEIRSHTLLKNAYPQFHPSSARELRAVVLANRNAPVSPIFTQVCLSDINIGK